MAWIPRDLNYVADQISRIVDYDDYTINVNVFVYFVEAWAPHTIHRFTCYYNNVIITRKLVVLIQSIFSLGQSVLMLSHKIGLMRQFVYVRPPVYMTVTVINHLRIFEAAGTLIVPLWIAAHYSRQSLTERV